MALQMGAPARGRKVERKRTAASALGFEARGCRDLFKRTQQAQLHDDACIKKFLTSTDHGHSAQLGQPLLRCRYEGNTCQPSAPRLLWD